MSYLIATEEISLSEQYRMRKEAIQEGVARAVDLWKVAPNDVFYRDADYVNDFIAPAGGAVALLAGWLTMPLNAVATYYSVFADVTPAAMTPTCPTNQIWVFYKVSQLTLAGPDPVGLLQFRKGTAANLKAQFDMEALCGKTVSDGYFSESVTYQNPEIATVQVQCRVAIAVGARVRLGCIIIEQAQNTLT